MYVKNVFETNQVTIFKQPKTCEIMYMLLLLLGLNFINVLCTAFAGADPKSVKKILLTYLVYFYTFRIHDHKSCA